MSKWNNNINFRKSRLAMEYRAKINNCHKSNDKTLILFRNILSSFFKSNDLQRADLEMIFFSVYNSIIKIDHKCKGQLISKSSLTKISSSKRINILRKPISNKSEWKHYLDNDVFHLQIKAARALLLISQKELADISGLSQKFISSAERNIDWTRRSPSTESIVTAFSLKGIDFVSETHHHGSGVKFAKEFIQSIHSQTTPVANFESKSGILGKIVRAGRELLGWTQYDLAKFSGHTVTDIVAYERYGITTLGIENATRTALKEQGIVFLNNDSNILSGVCLRRRI